MSGGKRRGRRALTATTIVAVLVAAAVAAAIFGRGGGKGTGVPRRAFRTEPVTRGEVSTEINVQGTLGFARERSLGAGQSGTLTWLPRAGKRIGFGQALYAIDARPVLLLEGEVPMWREFVPGMSGGPDVQELEADLAAMGYFEGTVDQTFTDATAEAIHRLQAALGEHCTPPSVERKRGSRRSGGAAPLPGEATAEPPKTGLTCGSLPLGSIVFGAEPVRIAGAKAAVGAPVSDGAPVVRVSAPRKVITADVELEDRRLARRGAAVSVSLPDGSSAKGIVERAAPAIEKQQPGGASAVVIPTTIGFRRQRAAKGFDHASVTIHFADVQSRDALTVPVEALVALDANRFGVEVPAANGAIRRMPVKTGLFAGGRVVVSGHGIHRGLEVVVP